MFGSGPVTSTTSRSDPGGVATRTRVVGHSTSPTTPSTIDMRGRVTWKS